MFTSAYRETLYKMLVSAAHIYPSQFLGRLPFVVLYYTHIYTDYGIPLPFHSYYLNILYYVSYFSNIISLAFAAAVRVVCMDMYTDNNIQLYL